jgi:hypothetical protein
MLAAASAWEFLAAATLIAGGAYALRRRIGDRALGVVMAFGSGVLIGSVAYELVQEAFDTHRGNRASPECSGSGRSSQSSPVPRRSSSASPCSTTARRRSLRSCWRSPAARLTMLADTMMPDRSTTPGPSSGSSRPSVLRLRSC